MQVIFKLISFVFVVTLFSCAPQKDNVVIPPYVLNEIEMTALLTDCYLAEGASGINVKQVMGAKVDSVYMFNPLKDNNCTKIKFDSSISFYTKHPVLFKQVYENVLEKLSQLEAKEKYE